MMGYSIPSLAVSRFWFQEAGVNRCSELAVRESWRFNVCSFRFVSIMVPVTSSGERVADPPSTVTECRGEFSERLPHTEPGRVGPQDRRSVAHQAAAQPR